MTKRSKGIIAIDGPAGSGKSTAARLLAARLKTYVHIDSGALYRCVTFEALRLELPLDDGPRLGELATGLNIRFDRNEGGVPANVILNGHDRSSAIRAQGVSDKVAIVSEHPEVRAVVDCQLRTLGQDGGVVIDGRDIGTNVFPDAEAKFYLFADLEERARRCNQREERVAERDRRDRERLYSPLKRPLDARSLDTTRLPIEVVVNYLHDHALPLLPH